MTSFVNILNPDKLAYFFIIITLFFFIINSLFLLFSKIRNNLGYNIIFTAFLTVVLVILYSTKNIIVFFALWEISTWLTYFLANNPEKSKKYLWISLLAEFIMLIAVSRTVASGCYQISEIAKIDRWNLLMFSLPFIVKSGIIPFNFWVGDMYTGADKKFVAYLSAVIGKLGVFGLLRVFMENRQFIHDELWIDVFIFLSGITALWATFKAVSSEDAIETLSFSSLSQVAFIFASVLLMDKITLVGGLLHYLNHLLIKAGMFIAVVYMWNLTGTTKFREMGDFVSKMPFTFLFFLMLGISLAGVPPMGGVVSKWLMYEGFITRERTFSVVLFFAAGVGSFLYVYRLLHSIFLGRKKKSIEKIKEMNWMALAPLAICGILAFLIGAYSKPFVIYTSKSLGYDMSALKTSIGFADISLVSSIFGALVVFAIILWFLLPKQRYVPDTEGYTAAAYLPKDIEYWDYSYSFYAPANRIGEKFVKLFSMEWAGSFWKEYIEAFGQTIRFIYNGQIKVYGAYLIAFMILCFLILRS